jgi:2-polyprenyl-3-methyl-5-hydroxy-6-metoxy-1,4-benzoquinol methylase
MSSDKNARASLVKTKWGFYQYQPSPTKDELCQYYTDRYYQEGFGSHLPEYDQEEIQWNKARAELIVLGMESLRQVSGFSALDVGCGEGWLFDALHARGAFVCGMDYSRIGIERWHPHLLPCFTQGDLYSLLEERCGRSEQIDMVFLGNVIEHVVDPENLLRRIKNLLAPSGLLVIVAPNDFSDLQEQLMAQGQADAPWWLGYPDHLSYFSGVTMRSFLTDMGFDLRLVSADSPIEFNLLTEQTNYVKDRTRGPDAHRRRMRIDNYLFGKSPEALFSIYRTLGSIGVGRNLIYYCSAK